MQNRKAYLQNYRNKYGDLMKKQIKEWFRKHTDYCKSYSKKWRQSHPEYHKEWQTKNHDTITVNIRNSGVCNIITS